MSSSKSFLLALICCSLSLAGPMDKARRWAEAKFLGLAGEHPAPAHMLAQLKSGALERNRIKDRPFSIAGGRFEHGVAMPSPGEITVRLPQGAVRFEAVVGVDSNDLGYYSNGGRGSVVASVEENGRELFRSGVLREGLAGVPVAVTLNGATEFKLELKAVGTHDRTWQAAWDQADWADARVTLADGTTLWLADVPLGPFPRAYSTAAPFSFRYDGRPCAELLKTWRQERTTRRLDVNRTEHVSTYTDPQSGLMVRAVAVAYTDYPVVEWTVFLKNTSASPTPILENVQALDAEFERTAEGEFMLHHAKGSPNSPTDFQPLTPALAPRAESDAAELQRLVGQWRSVADLYYGDFYPLTPYSTEATAWMAWQFNAPAGKRGMVQAFRRPESPFETARFRLSGINPGATYAVRRLDTQREVRHTGKELMKAGLAVTIGSKPGTVTFVYQQVQGAKP
jgi:hypothetical protein